VGPAAITGAIVELAMVAYGLILLFLWWRSARKQWPGRNPLSDEAGRAALSPWPGTVSDLLLLVLLALGGGMVLPALLVQVLRHTGLAAEVQLVLVAAAFQGGLLGGIALFQLIWGREPGILVSPLRSALRDGGAAFLVSLPLVYGVSLAWQSLLGLSGLPVEKQDVVEMFMGIRAPGLRVAFILIAAVVAPIGEELLFRAGLFRFFRGRAPRWIALLLPAVLFGGAHLLQAPLASLAVFAPLVMLGVVFSLAYERTGRITTTMVAHSLFNLNTIMLVLLGLNT
jgi:membrane protease YdiL (CAAX protease family)